MIRHCWLCSFVIHTLLLFVNYLMFEKASFIIVRSLQNPWITTLQPSNYSSQLIFCFNAKNGIYYYHAIMLELSKKFFTYFFAWNTQRKSLQKGSKDWTVLFFLLSSFKLLYKIFYSLFIFVEHYFRLFYSPSFIFM